MDVAMTRQHMKRLDVAGMEPYSDMNPELTNSGSGSSYYCHYTFRELWMTVQ